MLSIDLEQTIYRLIASEKTADKIINLLIAVYQLDRNVVKNYSDA